MRKMIDFNKTFKTVIIIYLAIFLAGAIVACVFGVKLDINFSGGTKISYSYTGTVDEKDIEAVVKKNLKGDFTITKSEAITGDTKTFEIALVGKKSISGTEEKALDEALQAKFKDNQIKVYSSNTVSPSIAGTFFLKSMVAVAITALLVVLYVGIRFRKIGGVSAALTALAALVFDVFITFFTCVFFRLQIDSNYMAVVLTILGYSLNDTIVVYDRVRENRRLNPDIEIGESVNASINQTFKRNVVTSVTTFMAVTTIVIVSELFGLESLRTFAIPMAFGIVSGSITSLFIAGPLWVVWKRSRAKKTKKA